jgi:hypothetical protein
VTQLDIDSTAAIQKNMSYGKYIALYGHVRDATVVLDIGSKYKACEFCGALFEAKGNKRFCNARCSNMSRHDQIRARARARDGVSERTVKCSVCGITFTTHYGQKMTCSPKCSRRRAKAKQLESYYRKKTEGANEQA